jgi:hypothetical protein
MNMGHMQPSTLPPLADENLLAQVNPVVRSPLQTAVNHFLRHRLAVFGVALLHQSERCHWSLADRY